MGHAYDDCVPQVIQRHGALGVLEFKLGECRFVVQLPDSSGPFSPKPKMCTALP